MPTDDPFDLHTDEVTPEKFLKRPQSAIKRNKTTQQPKYFDSQDSSKSVSLFSCISDAERHEQDEEIKLHEKLEGMATENNFTIEDLELVKESHILRLIAETANAQAYKIRNRCCVKRVDAESLSVLEAEE